MTSTGLSEDGSMMARRIDNVTCGKLVLDAFLAHGTPQAAALIHAAYATAASPRRM